MDPERDSGLMVRMLAPTFCGSEMLTDNSVSPMADGMNCSIHLAWEMERAGMQIPGPHEDCAAP